MICPEIHDGLGGFFWRLYNDKRYGSFDIVGDFDAETAVNVLKLLNNKISCSTSICFTKTYPYVVFHVARHHQDIRNLVDRSVFVQQSQSVFSIMLPLI